MHRAAVNQIACHKNFIGRKKSLHRQRATCNMQRATAAGRQMQSNQLPLVRLANLIQFSKQIRASKHTHTQRLTRTHTHAQQSVRNTHRESVTRASKPKLNWNKKTTNQRDRPNKQREAETRQVCQSGADMRRYTYVDRYVRL